MSPPISTKRFSEIRITISEHIQTKNWSRLLHTCETSDSEVAKSIAMIFSLHSPESVWPLIDYALHLSAEDRRSIRNSIATLCYAIGRLEQPDLGRSVSALRVFLSEDHMLLAPVVSALSNFWVIEPKLTAGLLYKKWILQNQEENDDLPVAAVSSCKYMYQNSPESVTPFLAKVVALSDENPT